jgi:hypothetical protein
MCKIKFAGGRLKMSSYVSANNLAFIKSDIHLGPVHQSSSVRVTTDHDRGSGEKQRKERRNVVKFKTRGRDSNVPNPLS